MHLYAQLRRDAHHLNTPKARAQADVSASSLLQSAKTPAAWLYEYESLVLAAHKQVCVRARSRAELGTRGLQRHVHSTSHESIAGELGGWNLRGTTLKQG